MTWVKTTALRRLVGGIVVLWLFAFFAFDPALKYALERAGRTAAGAKVDVGSLRSRWLRGTIEVRRVAVADADKPMTNVVELSRAAFALDVGAALRGKAVIREAALEGLRFGTPRATSGALPRAAPSKLGRAVREKLAPEGGALLPAAPPSTSPPRSTRPTAGPQKIERPAKAQIDRWKANRGEPADRQESRDIADQLKALGGGDSPPTS